MTRPKILIVDDEERFGANLVKILAAHSLRATAVLCGEDALAEMAKTPYDVVLLDMKMPGLSGTATLKRIREAGHKAKVIVLSGTPRWTTRWS